MVLMTFETVSYSVVVCSDPCPLCYRCAPHPCMQIHQIPASISSLQRLRALSVASNRLWQIPASMCGCSALRLLDCSHNLLSRLPQGLSQLINLRSLKLTHNRYVWAYQTA